MLRSIFEIDGLIDLIRHDHAFTPARSFGSVERLERREGLHLPQDMLRFYTEFDGARLFGNEYILLDPDGILPFDTVIRAVHGGGPHMPDSWVTFCRTRDGHWVAIDLAPSARGEHFVAVFRHAGECDGPTVEVVAPSFACFLALALVSRRHPYWLDLHHPSESRSASS
jgi:cell wall assembly regulator SMI1